MKPGDCIRIRAKPGVYVQGKVIDYFKMYKVGGMGLFGSTLKLTGDLWKLYTLDNDASPDTTAYTFEKLFYAATWLEDAGDATVGGTVDSNGTELIFGDYAFHQTFTGCRNLKRAPKIMSKMAEFDHIYEDMYTGCGALQEIHWNRELEDKWQF